MPGARVTGALSTRLAIVRIALGALCLWSLLRHPDEVPGLGAEPGALFVPVGVAALLDAPVPPAFVAVWQAGTAVLALGWILGWRWRVTGPCFALAFLAWTTWRLSWGAIAHDLHLATLHVLALALVPAAATLSLDARAPSRRLAWIPTGAAAAVWARGGIRLVGALTVLTYLLAGLAKIERHWDFSWAEGTNLADQISFAALIQLVYAPAHGLPPGYTFLLDHPALLSFGAAATLALELGAPLALAHRWLGVAWAAGILAMHLGIAATMGVVFPYPTAGLAFLSFLPVERLLRRRG